MMPYKLFHRLLQRILPSPAREPTWHGDGAAALAAAGATRLAGPPARGNHTSDQPLTVDLPPMAPDDTALLAVLVLLAAPATPLDLRLIAADGTLADALHCPAGPGHRAVTLFAAPQPGLRLEVAGAAPIELVRTELWHLDAAACSPARLVPHSTLAPDPAWSRAYGTPNPWDTAARLRARVFAAMTAPALVSLLDGLQIWLEPGDELSRALLLSGTYEPDTLTAIRTLLPSGGVCVDVGAHCGMVSLFAARCVGRQGRVLAFEPSPREFARLSANVAAGDLIQVEIHQAALAEAPGTVTLRLAEPGHAGHNTIGSAFAYADVVVAALHAVPATTLDAALAGLARCDLVKMDIEGAELRALRGGAVALARLRPALILEVFDRALAGSGDTVDGLFAWLAANGYEARDIDPATGRFEAPAQIAPGESKNIVALPVPT